VRWAVVLIVVVACSSERTRPDAGSAQGVHPSGILDETSPDFHVKELERRGWDLELCATCHGTDYAGGASGKTCLACHPAGPTACVTCHQDGPTSGAHRVHRDAGQTCAECHVVPTRWDDAGHIRDDAGPAEITFGARAAQTLIAADRAGPPTYAGGTCTNVYCHGAVLHAGGGTAPLPRWDDPTPAGGCDRCHGAPPPSHAQSACESCHRTPAGAAPHLDGVVELGGGCNGCHGDATSPAPPRDLTGGTLTTALGVGAHRAHLEAPSRLRGPMACTECHRVPTTIGETGHLDSPLPAEVFPVGSGVLARADGAVPVWDRITATCSGSYCHGDGAQLAADTSPGRLTTPMWTASTGQVFCGSCHGLPPTTPAHTPTMTLGDCATCHPRTVDGFGNILLGGTPGAVTSEHLDGDVDVF
jgi:predicted CxxxxCH...CXXCH cytochrome family protein